MPSGATSAAPDAAGATSVAGAWTTGAEIAGDVGSGAETAGCERGAASPESGCDTSSDRPLVSSPPSTMDAARPLPSPRIITKGSRPRVYTKHGTTPRSRSEPWMRL
jgi:hypothetical protein